MDDRDVARFWSKVDKLTGPPHPHDASLGQCWVWTSGSDRDGYGKFSLSKRSAERNKRSVRAHRLALIIASGRTAKMACHTCDNPACCNPAHLYWGDVVSNAKDMVLRGRAATGLRNARYTRPWNTARGVRNGGGGKLNDATVREIRARYAAEDISQTALGADYGVCQNVIGQIVHGELWKHVV